MSLGKKLLILLAIVVVIQIAIAIVRDKVPYGQPSKLGDIAKIHRVFLQSDDAVKKMHAEKPGLTKFMQLNITTFVVSWLVIILWILIGLKVRKNLNEIPGRLQAFLEILMEFFDDLTTSTLGKKLGRKYFALIATIFIFVLSCNYAGLFPSVWHLVYKKVDHNKLEINRAGKLVEVTVEEQKGFGVVPEWFVLEEPTQDLNTTLGLGILVFVIVLWASIRKKGFLIGKIDEHGNRQASFIKEMCEPFVVMFPLNVIGELGKLISHSFRLFGNIKGGVIIMIVVSYLVGYVLLPIGLIGFFGIFVGLVQAFVFAMLALVYIAVGIAED